MAKSNAELESEITELEKRVVELEEKLREVDHHIGIRRIDDEVLEFDEDERFPPPHLGMDAKLQINKGNFPTAYDADIPE